MCLLRAPLINDKHTAFVHVEIHSLRQKRGAMNDSWHFSLLTFRAPPLLFLFEAHFAT